MIRALASAVALFWAGAAFAASPCVSCHREQARSQPQTDMAWALVPPESNRVLKDHPTLSFRRGAFTYTVETRDGHSTYSVTDGVESIALPVRWSFGVRSQTWVFEREGKFYESLVSFYAPIDGLDVTIGDAALAPRTVREAFGRELSDFEARSCFGCHATGAVSGSHLQLDAALPGVQCERCHTGAERHAQSLAAGKPSAVPPKLAALTAEEMSNFCGQCHRTWERVVRDRLRGPINVRFQPYRLANSKCYDGGDPRMSCVACHDPHQEVARGAASYDAKCVACHSAEGAHKVCRVAGSGCADCHMPKVELPGAHMRFTDHQIRIVRAGERYPD